MCLVISGISSSNSSTLLKVIKQWLAHVPIIKKAIYSPFHSDCQAKIQQLPPIYQTLPQDFELLHQFLHFYQDKWRVLQTATVLTQTKNFYTKTSFLLDIYCLNLTHPFQSNNFSLTEIFCVGIYTDFNFSRKCSLIPWFFYNRSLQNWLSAKCKN